MMHDKPRILLIIGSNPATIAFANSFIENHEIVGLIQQAGGPEGDNYSEIKSIHDKPEYSFEKEVEESVLGYVYDCIYLRDHNKVPQIKIDKGSINKPASINWINKLKPDLIISHGPERLSQELINIAKYGGINVHWGLSPTYRGTHTIRWPLLEGKPEWIGVTIHLLDQNLDTGSIIYQAKPKLVQGYSFRQIEYSLTNLACKILPQAVKEVLSGQSKMAQQDLTIGRTYHSKDWAQEYEVKLTVEYIARQIRKYHANKQFYDDRVILINEWTNG